MASKLLDIFSKQLTRINSAYIEQLIAIADEYQISREKVICKAAACVIGVADLFEVDENIETKKDR